MHDRPDDVTDAEVLAAVRTHWSTDVTAVEHLAVGFGAHHWRADLDHRSRLFVTLDALSPRHSLDSLERCYAAAAELEARGLEFVVPSIPSRSGTYTTALGSGRLSCVAWVEGVVVGGGPHKVRSDAERTAEVLDRLHRVDPVADVRRWRPLGARELADTLRSQMHTPWSTGPYGPLVRSALDERLSQISDWVEKYHRLADLASAQPWVVTHGEPHTANQMETAAGLVLVDWESIMVAPRERDLRVLVDSGFAHLVHADPTMIALFDLEWRLDEISAYARWFAAPHTGNASDAEAYAGLMEELNHP